LCQRSEWININEFKKNFSHFHIRVTYITFSVNISLVTFLHFTDWSLIYFQKLLLILKYCELAQNIPKWLIKKTCIYITFYSYFKMPTFNSVKIIYVRYAWKCANLWLLSYFVSRGDGFTIILLKFLPQGHFVINILWIFCQTILAYNVHNTQVSTRPLYIVFKYTAPTELTYYIFSIRNTTKLPQLYKKWPLDKPGLLWFSAGLLLNFNFYRHHLKKQLVMFHCFSCMYPCLTMMGALWQSQKFIHIDADTDR
jgi:hypothetical protein